MHVFGFDVGVYHVFRTSKSSHASCAHLPAVFNLQRKTCKVRHKGYVYGYFERESKKNKKIHQGIVKLKKKTVDATRLSKRTVEFVIEVGGSSSSEDDHSSDGVSSDSSSVSSDSD